MKTIYGILMEVCADRGITDARGQSAELAKLLGVSRGRVSQLLNPEIGGKLGAKSQASLVKLGYNPTWLSGDSLVKWLKDAPKDELKDSRQTVTADTILEQFHGILKPFGVELETVIPDIADAKLRIEAELHKLPSNEIQPSSSRDGRIDVTNAGDRQQTTRDKHKPAK